MDFSLGLRYPISPRLAEEGSGERAGLLLLPVGRSNSSSYDPKASRMPLRLRRGERSVLLLRAAKIASSVSCSELLLVAEPIGDSCYSPN